ncbi:MAG: OprO/OprP family phosphate-selective porin [Candidatus Cryptobacteroides sp.]
MKKVLFISAALLAFAVSANAQHVQEVQEEYQYNQYGQKVSSLPVNAQLQDGILVFQNKQANYKMWFDVRVQGDAAVYFGYDKNLVSIGNGMSMRRTRFAVKAQLDEKWYGEIDTDWTSGTPELKDAILEYTGVPNLSIKMGNFKENFSIQRNTTSRYLQFMERPMVTALAPSRHMGVAATWSCPLVWVSGGVFGPELKSSEEMTAMEDGNKDYGLNEGLSYTGKVAIRPINNQTSSLHIGAAVSYREPKLTSTDGYNAIRYSSRNSTGINRKKFLDTDAIKGLDHELAYTIELAGHWKQLRYEGAYIARSAYLDPEKTVIPKDELGPQTADGWYVQAGWLLFGGQQNYDSNGGKYTRINPGRSWGDVELCARYEVADFNCSKYYAGGSAQAFTLGLNFYPTKNVKFVINYQYNINDKYANGKGANDGTDEAAKWFVGYDADGNKCKVPSQIVGNTGICYSMLACRFQVAF